MGRTTTFVQQSVAGKYHSALQCWAEALLKIARMTLTIKRDGNWSSFQLTNSALPLSVTSSAIAPSARMPGRGPLEGRPKKIFWQSASLGCVGCMGPMQRGTLPKTFENSFFLAGACASYLLGLLAMIKCSICSYQCDN